MAEVLLVDDDGSVLLTTAIALRRRGHDVTMARNGWQALMFMARRRFGVLVSDVRMPGMSGLELAARVHQLVPPPRVILVSAQNVEVASHLAEAFLSKPVDVDELSQLLSNPTSSIREPDTAALKAAAEHENHYPSTPRPLLALHLNLANAHGRS